MATYIELFDLRNDSALQNKVTVAVTIKAQTMFDLATPTAKQLDWCLKAIANPSAYGQDYLKYLLAKNAALSVAQIQAATDAAIQAAVNALVDKVVA
jgi:hypothetical protein